MTNGQDMLARIKSRSQRPKVDRDTSLTAQGPESKAAAAEFAETSFSPTAESPASDPSVPPVSEAVSPAWEDQLAQLIQVAPRRNIRLEERLDHDIERFVQQQDLTIETLLEACYLALQIDTDLRDQVVAQARERLAERKEAGKLRRLYSQMQKLKG